MIMYFSTIDHSPSIHDLINSAAGITFDCQAHNTLLMLRSARRNGSLLTKLEELGGSGMIVRMERRKANCRKWAKRIKETIKTHEQASKED